ncbi:hypothetical protein F4815DRAFT_443124 [Daldinia loculata]|nr:hypothetical protein F4815DRAFT_443124 [Daldinia loculata]
MGPSSSRGKPQHPKKDMCSTCGDELPSRYRFKDCEKCAGKQGLGRERATQEVPTFHQTTDQKQARTDILAEEAPRQANQRNTNADVWPVTNEIIDLTQSPISEYHGNNDTYSYLRPGFKYQGGEFKYKEYENISPDPVFQFPLSNSRDEPMENTPSFGFNRLNIWNTTPAPRHQKSRRTMANLIADFKARNPSDTTPVFESHGNQSTVANPVPNIPQHQHHQYANNSALIKMSLSFICN